MNSDNYNSVEALRDIKSIMERSARFISLSGWSGVWAGSVGLAGAYIAHSWLNHLPGNYYYNIYRSVPSSEILSAEQYHTYTWRFMFLAIIVLTVALTGGIYFTWRKTRLKGQTLWNAASKRMVEHMTAPMLAGGVFAILFLYNGHEMYIAPTCLVFYGMALINGSKYTLSDIKYLGYLEVLLGIVNMLLPGYGLTCWAIGFGVLHIVYGVIMWNKYDKKGGSATA